MDAIPIGKKWDGPAVRPYQQAHRLLLFFRDHPIAFSISVFIRRTMSRASSSNPAEISE